MGYSGNYYDNFYLNVPQNYTRIQIKGAICIRFVKTLFT